MSYQLIVKEEAVIEIEDAFLWYEKEKEGLGWEFIAALEGYYEKIFKTRCCTRKVIKIVE